MELNMNTNNENELIQEFQRTGDPKLGSLLADRYDYLVTTACRTLYMTWADHEDILQEGRIGLFKALRDFEPERGVSFRSFATRCIRCECISAINKANRYKHAILNQALSLNVSVFEDNEKTCWLDTIADQETKSPVHDLIIQDDFESCEEVLKQILSPYAYQVFISRLQGNSYEHISQQLQHDSKSIDNALQRCRRQIAHYMDNHDDIDIDTLRHFCQYIANYFRDSDDLTATVS